MDGNCHTRVSILIKAKAIMETGRSGTQSWKVALMKAFREGFLEGMISE